MAFLRKKKDPISERAKTLNEQIASLQAEIERLSNDPPPEQEASTPFKSPKSATQPLSPPKKGKTSGSPRLRSTAIPQREAISRALSKAPPPTSAEPVFEQLGPSPAAEAAEPPSVSHYNDLGVRKYDLASLWKRWSTHFRGPATNNPKLVNYLAAGSIQGLRPLRYEKRVARNRFILFFIFLIAVLWGLIAIWIKRS